MESINKRNVNTFNTAEILIHSNMLPNVVNLPEGFSLPIFGTLAICVISFYILKWFNNEMNVPIRDSTKTHNWKAIKFTAKAWYCSICESFLLNGIGVYCDCCGVCADAECVKIADKKLPCKMTTSNGESQSHHWVKGNLPLGATCTICSEECALEPGLIDYQCCWCQRAVHTECFAKIGEECDFGQFKNMIVPPWCVQVAKHKRLHRHLLLKAVKDPGWEDWSPLIVIANRKSGNKDGDLILSEFRRHLNPVQVVDLADRKPASALQWCILLANRKLKVLVGGGDGTVSWVLTTAHKLDLEPEPSIAILPLGTGNDLSRVLKWGKENPAEIDVHAVLQDIQKAHVTNLDRWKVEMLSTKHLGIRIPNKTVYMYNYFSIGVDAQVALDFHKTRESQFYVFGSRVFNKLLYLCFGTQQVMSSDCKNLHKRLELFLDGKQVPLPELESIIVLNISSWGAGVNLWGLTGRPKSSQSYNDGILEVVGVYSSFHIAQLQMGLSSPLVLGQAKVVDIHVKGKAPVQVDGEPWEQHFTHIHISLVNKASVLSNRSKK